MPKYVAFNNDYKIAYRFYKRSKKTIIFLHGLMSNMDGVKSKFLSDYAKKNNFSFLTFDFRGHGKSSGEFVNYGVIDWYDDLNNTIKYLNISKFILIGSSMGGWVAIYFALKYPKKVEKLIGIAPAPDFTINLILRELSKSQLNKIKNNKIVKKKVSQNFYYQYSPNLFKNSSAALICNIKKKFDKEVIFFHGGKDRSLPFDYNDQFLKNSNFSNLKIIILKHADHGMSDKESLKNIIKFI